MSIGRTNAQLVIQLLRNRHHLGTCVNQWPTGVDFGMALLCSWLLVIMGWGALGGVPGGVISGASSIPCSGNCNNWNGLDVLDNFAIFFNCVSEESKGFLVA